MIHSQLIAQENIEGSITYRLLEEDKNTKTFMNTIKKNFASKKSDAKYLSPKPIKKRVFKINKNDKAQNDYSSVGNSDKNEKTLFEMIKDTKSGIPMAKTKSESDYLQNKRKSSTSENHMSRKNSVMSNERQIMTRKKSENNNDKNYDKYFRPKLIWDPIENKMIIEKPKFYEATQKMNEEINRNIEAMDNIIAHKHHLTSLSFKKLKHTDKWTEQETNLFFKALECFGTDFSFLEIILKPRTRNQIKNKYKKEERDNKEMIDSTLKRYDPTKLNKILAVVNHVRQFEVEQKKKKSKKSKTEKIPFDFKKLFDEIELNQEIVEVKEEINRILKEDNVKDSDEEEVDESDKTVSVNYEEDENEEDCGEKKEEKLKYNQKNDGKRLSNQNFNLKSFYQSKVSFDNNCHVVSDKRIVIAKHEEKPKEEKIVERINISEEAQEENNIGNIFLKQMQHFHD